MFQKKDYIYSETQGVCQVENIVLLQSGNGPQVSYYVLRPYYDREQVSYIPVENHQVKLRPMFTPEEARELAESEQVKKDEKVQQAVEFVLKGGES